MPSSIEKRVLKVVAAAERGGPDTFPSVASGINEADEANEEDLDGANTVNAADLAPFDLDNARLVMRELQDTVEYSKSQLDIDPDPQRDTTTTTTPAIGLGIPTRHSNAVVEDFFDPDKTQTTPSKSQRPFQFDISGLNIPSIEW